MTNVLLFVIYAIIGLICVSLAVSALRTKGQQARVGTALFWSLLGIIFILGDYIPANIVGVLIIVMAILSATKQVKLVSFNTTTSAPSSPRNRRRAARARLPRAHVARGARN